MSNLSIQQKSSKSHQQVDTNSTLTSGSHSGSIAAPVSSLGSIARFASPPPENATLAKFYLQSLARELLPGEKVARCLRAIIPGQHEVGIERHEATNSAHFTNLRTCDSVWACPVCAAKISERRAAELSAAATRWQAEYGFVALLTFTLSHHKGDRLADMLTAIRKAYRRFKSGKGYQYLLKKYGWFGSVAALEVTYGANGWHVHLHVLAFFHPLAGPTWREFPDAVKRRWLSVLAAEGCSADWTHGADVTDQHAHIAEYIAKFGKLPADSRWTLEREVAKAPVKKAREGGRTPFQLLADYGDGDALAGRLFQEYAREFKGRHQLQWSPGLREYLGLGLEQTDAEIVAEQEPDSVEFARLNSADWYRILHLSRDVRGELLVIAGKGDFQAFQAFLSGFGVFVGEIKADAAKQPVEAAKGVSDAAPVNVQPVTIIPDELPGFGNLVKANDLWKFGY